MIQDIGAKYIPAEICTVSQVLRGNVFCPVKWRVSDLLNSAYMSGQNTRDEFLEFIPSIDNKDGDIRERIPKEYIRKGAINLLALSDNDLRRGIGSAKGQRVYPFKNKHKTPVRLQIDINSNSHTLFGYVHCSQEQTTKDVLDDERSFLSLTDVVMPRDFKISGNKPFVAVKKDSIVSCGEQELSTNTNVVVPRKESNTLDDWGASKIFDHYMDYYKELIKELQNPKMAE